MVKTYPEAQCLANGCLNMICIQNQAFNESAASSFNQNENNSKRKEPAALKAFWDAVKAFNPSDQYELREKLNQYINQTYHKPVIPINELKQELLNVRRQDWNNINKYKSVEEKLDPIFRRVAYVESEGDSVEIVINIDCNQAVFCVPAADEAFIHPLLDMFSGPGYKDFLSLHSDYFETAEDIVQFVVFNPIIIPGQPSYLAECTSMNDDFTDE